MKSIRIDVDGAVGTITIDRRERFNSLDVETARDLRKAGLQLARDNAIRAVVLRGSGGVFCSGADLKYIRGGGDAKGLGYLQAGNPATRQPGNPNTQQPTYGDVFKQILEYIHSTISEIRRAPKPFIAAVDGIAAAGGFGLAMSCDLVIASDRAMFEWAYAKTGLTGAESSTFMLPRLVGLRRAFELLFLNPRITPERALEIGLITAVYPAATFDAEVDAIAKKVAEGPTEAMGIAKELINQAAGMDRLDVHLDREIDQLARIADGADFAEGIDAFFAKRQPKFGVS
ncbi:MAG TPA: enoyl-CoA hydratase-related protein [Thermoanaerobaculia bacterium]|nr:enoyl-CoA hydratase-related protein [Thermoanaerobaculia bacterium]